MNRAISIGILLAAWLLAATPAMANGPPERRSASGRPFVGSVCDPPVPVLVTATTDNEVSKSFYQNGQLIRVITTGALKLTLTNMVNGKTISENIGGPGTLTLNPDGSGTLVVRGLNSGQVGDLTTSGRLVFDVAPDGATTLVSPIHHSTNLCTALS